MVRWAAIGLLALALAGCAGGEDSSGARLGSGESLPECSPGKPAPSATAAFVADGKAWAVRANDTGITCLFDVPRAGPFVWGPRGDRALLDGLAVQGLAGAPHRDASTFTPRTASWGRPTGKSIVFVGRDGHALLKAHMGRRRLQNITPLGDARYLNVVYHPSGRALAFVVQRGSNQSIWLSTNTGTEPRRLAFSTTGTRFGALAFTASGAELLYAARHRGGRGVLHWLSLGSGGASELWSRPKTEIRAIFPSQNPQFVALTIGPSCAHSRALVVDLAKSKARPLLPREVRPTKVIGWLGSGKLLAGAGACGGPFDVSAVDARTRLTVPLASGVTAAATRLPEPKPPPPLPDEPQVPGSGFA